MFLEYWIIGVLGGLLVLAIISTDKKSRREGYTKGVEHGADMALKILEDNGIVEVNNKGEILGINHKKLDKI